jgi:hypothetical protein
MARNPEPATVPLAAVRAMLDAMEAYVPPGQRENARAHALAVGIGYAYPGPSLTASSDTPTVTD